MKNGICIALALAPLLSQAQDNVCKISLQMRGMTGTAKAYLVYEYGMNTQQVLDSSLVKNGKFFLKGKVTDQPVKAEVVVDHTGVGLSQPVRKVDMLVVYLEKGQLLVNGKDSVKHAVVSGSRLNTEYARYRAAVLDGPDKRIDEVDAEFAAAPADKKKDTAFVNGLMTRVRQLWAEKDSLKYDFIRRNRDSYFSLEALEETAGNDIDVSVVEPLFKSLSSRLRSSKKGMAFARSIDRARATSIGAMALDFVQNDVEGRPVKLSDFRGKYVLVDFWASWCGPCRGENPNVLKAFAAYKDKNFTVLGVSLDGKREAWLAAIKADGLPWTQVSDLQAWNNAAAKQYGIMAIPQNFLIDPAGKIVAKNLRGEELDKKLKELL